MVIQRRLRTLCCGGGGTTVSVYRANLGKFCNVEADHACRGAIIEVACNFNCLHQPSGRRVAVFQSGRLLSATRSCRDSLALDTRRPEELTQRLDFPIKRPETTEETFAVPGNLIFVSASSCRRLTGHHADASFSSNRL